MKTILFVEDEDIFYQLFNLIASKFSFNALIASNLAEAMKKLKENKIDLAIIDYELPDGKGDMLNGYIKKHFPEISTAIASGYGTMLLSRNEYDYCVDKSKLIDFIREYLDHHNE